MRAIDALRRLLHNSDRLISIDNRAARLAAIDEGIVNMSRDLNDRLAAIDEGIVNLSHDLNSRLDKLAELHQAQLVMERDIVEAIEPLTAATEIRR